MLTESSEPLQDDKCGFLFFSELLEFLLLMHFSTEANSATRNNAELLECLLLNNGNKQEKGSELPAGGVFLLS